MTKFRELPSGRIIELDDDKRIKKFRGYPDKFEEIIEKSKGTPNSTKREDTKEIRELK